MPAQLTALISAVDIATAGTSSVTVVNPAPGGGTSPAASFTINNPVPSISSLSPSSASAGEAAFTLTVNGSDFISASAVQWNGSGRKTSYVSATQLKASITAADIATAGTTNVTVVNPAPGGGTSPTASFITIRNPTSVFFGIHQAHYEGCDKTPYNYPLFDAAAGAYRDFGACNTLWAEMNPAQDKFDFSGLDTLYSALYARGVDDVFIVLGNTPNWISSNKTDGACDLANLFNLPAGMCDPPADLNPDGTGTDLAWRSFVTALLQHVTASGYASTHAHIQLYEIWDEFQRSDTINAITCGEPRSGTPSCSYRGTFAQMLRMTQDLRCIVEGHASDPITALHTTCGQDATMPARGLDPTALVTEGDSGGEFLDQGNQVMQNYLYCNNNPPAGSMCNYGSAGGASVDFISGHSYFTNGRVPEDLMTYIAAEKSMLSPADAAKPYIIGEGSWGHNLNSNGDPAVSDPELQAAFVVRWYMALLMSDVSRGYWYSWDSPTGTGGLWSPTSMTFPPLECTTPNATIGGYDCTGEIAYEQTVNWLYGATVANFSCAGSCTNPDPGIFTLNLTRSGGYQAQILWDSTVTSSCANPQCGSTPLPALPFTATQWRDVAGNTHSGAPISIGAAPVVIENMAPPSP